MNKILPFTQEFALWIQKQWEAFCKRVLGNSKDVSSNFLDIVECLQKFLEPIVWAITAGDAYDKRWNFEDGIWEA
ncbi:MAG: hypothetical protein FWC26_13745 [Fibromonadales bacterium]|nr:hypothetical protein [Fibromonadales bacterium]